MQIKRTPDMPKPARKSPKLVHKSVYHTVFAKILMEN